MDPQPIEVKIQWNDAIEGLIKSLGEKAHSLSLLHSASEKRYSYLNNYLALPSIILSSIASVISVGFGSDGGISYVSGGISILVSILSTLNSYFSYAKRAESHRITSISYSKLYLQITIELALPRKKRMNVKDYIKMVSESIQRLNEIQPQIADTAIRDYIHKFKAYIEEGKIAVPEQANGLVNISIYKEPEIIFEPSIQAPPTPPPSATSEAFDVPKSKKPVFKI